MTAYFGRDFAPPKAGRPAPALNSGLCGLGLRMGLEVIPHLGGGPIDPPLQDPFSIVSLNELADDSSGLLEVLKPVNPNALLLEDPHEVLGHAVTQGSSNVGIDDLDAPPAQRRVEDGKSIMGIRARLHGK